VPKVLAGNLAVFPKFQKNRTKTISIKKQQFPSKNNEIHHKNIPVKSVPCSFFFEKRILA